MNDLMLVKNVVYILKECPVPTFLLKSEIQQAFEEGGAVIAVEPRECMKFNGKYYAYYEIKQKEDGEQPIREADNGDSGQ